MRPATLKRSIGFGLLTLYGLGTILGAGIYVLIGEVARVAGAATPAAFMLAGLIAGFSALSYAELCSRLPKSAGEAAYVEAAFGLPFAAVLTGWAVIATGVVSAATLARGFVGYLEVFVNLPDALVLAGLVAGLAALAAWGIAESLWAAGIVTAIEALGLIGVCIVARDALGAPPDRWAQMLPGIDVGVWAGVLSGAFVAFYAYIGFEDMVNIAEEVIEPERTLPRAIVAALVLSMVLYLLVTVVASLALPIDALAAADAPMALVVESRGYSPQYIALVGLFAVLNGALVQLVMASRVLYGLGAQGLAWSAMAYVHAGRRTPIAAIALAAGLILAFAFLLPLVRLAQITSFIALAIFTTMNLSLIVLKRRDAAAFTVSPLVPVVGAALAGGMLAIQLAATLGAWTR
ncbi:MAG TPA: amino acid permease [Gammaproteobacteria bacterium]|nr:amino acid permease [Gammaproteobacteria bacterium]